MTYKHNIIRGNHLNLVDIYDFATNVSNSFQPNDTLDFVSIKAILTSKVMIS